MPADESAGPPVEVHATQTSAAHLMIAMVNRGRAAYGDELRSATTSQQLRMHYQPQYELVHGDVVGLEGFVRWARPGHGLLPASAFLNEAHHQGVLANVGAWAINKVCDDAAWLRSRGLSLDVTVSVWDEQFAEPGLITTVTRALQKSGLPPASLTLKQDLTPQRASAVANTVRVLRTLGVRFAMQVPDHVTKMGHDGHADSTTHLRLPAQHSLWRDPAAVEQLVADAHRQGLTVTADRVEHEEELRQAWQAHADRAQGYLLGSPTDLLDLVPRLLASHTSSRAAPA